ncbi:MAG: glycosyltransferase family 2 protein [Nitrospira sp.]|nr:glycosyltransferase family 2 protein [bacterium]MBL7047955.1 glycosyltransferase family 2 protein [Nitrospira sp.]
MKISIIIVSFNTSEILHKCLSELYAHPVAHEMEVFIVDNNSYDNSVEMIRENYKDIILIENKTNMGFAAANNQAYKLAGGSYIILLNPDAYLKAGAIDNAITFMETHTDCALCGGRLINLQGTLDPSARKYPGSLAKLFIISGLSSRYASSKIFSKSDMNYFDHNSVMEVDWVPGTFTVYRASALKDHGLFDERFYIYYEETDLCLNLKRKGWKIYFIPDAEVIHVGGASSKVRKDLDFDESGAQVLKFRMRSEYLYFRKNHGLLSVLANASVEIGWHGLRYMVNLLRGSSGTMKCKESFNIIKHAIAALKETRAGSISPCTPW